jgi:PleD family two-component response regulator
MQVCKKVREQYSASVLPVIMVSAKSQEGDVVKGLKAGANDYLTKVSNALTVRLTSIKLKFSVGSIAGYFILSAAVQFGLPQLGN